VSAPIPSTVPTADVTGEPVLQARRDLREKPRPTFVDRWLAARVQASIRPARIRLELWDGSSTYADAAPPIGDLVVHDRSTLIGLIVNPDLHFGEAYMAERLDVRGSLSSITAALGLLAPLETTWRDRIAAALSSANTLSRSRRHVHHHYDLGNAFYERWLDRRMVYTCAYFAREEMSLDEAQRAKLDLVCRKLRLRPGESVVEAGCGWGSLALHMARHYGVRVKAFNISREQIAYARERAAREGLTDRIEFIDDDYRNVSGQFDAFVSIGMLEHVGRRNLAAVGKVLHRTLRRDGGRGLVHFIGRDVTRPLNAWIRRRIFPGAYTPTLAEVTARILSPAGMSVIDVENLRLHYARTLAAWGDRFTAATDYVRAHYGDEFLRAWQLYLAGSEAAFTTGWLQLFQVVFTPRGSSPPSWTRSDPFDSTFDSAHAKSKVSLRAAPTSVPPV
jgi:cyclopropane-fatty-acyl-phospholipid synthase